MEIYDENYNEVSKYGHYLSGVIIETGGTIDAFLNVIISTYFCIEDGKLDDLVGFVQESKIPFKIDYFKIIIKEIDPLAISLERDFKYLKKNENVLVKTIIQALNSFFSLRNKFGHNSICPESKSENGDMFFSLEEFRPRSDRGNKNGENTIKKSLYNSSC